MPLAENSWALFGYGDDSSIQNFLIDQMEIS